MNRRAIQLRDFLVQVATVAVRLANALDEIAGEVETAEADGEVETPAEIEINWEGDVVDVKATSDDAAERLGVLTLLATLRRQAMQWETRGSG
jgi:hypothetical protein